MAYNFLSLPEGWGKDRNNNNLKKKQITAVSIPISRH